MVGLEKVVWVDDSRRGHEVCWLGVCFVVGTIKEECGRGQVVSLW